MKEKKLLFTITIKDCRVDSFTVGGNGGSGKDTSNTGARVTHYL
jgi:protein subunit release factor A